MSDVKPENCISCEEILRNDDLLVIDVRTLPEIERGKIEAKRWANIPVGEFNEALDYCDAEFEDKYKQSKPKMDGSDLVIYCGSGKRSAMALSYALAKDYKKARHYPGGYGRWVNDPALKKQ